MVKESFYKKYLRPVIRHKVFSLVVLLAFMIILFSVWSNAKGGNFFTASTFKNIFNSIILSAFLAIGAGCLLISGNLDLSAAAVGAFGGMIVATGIVRWGMPSLPSIIIALAFCGLLGAVNATLVTRLRFPAFIATFAMTSMAKGIMYYFSSIGNPDGVATNVAVSNRFLTFLSTSKVASFKIGSDVLDIPFGVVIMLVFFAVYGIIISKSKFGLKMMLMGGNPVAATLAGINSRRITYILFINASICGGIAGLFSTARLGQGSLLALQTNQYTGITAAILGGVSFGGGSGGMGGVLVGLLILLTFQMGMSTVGVNPFWVNVFSGIILLVALTVDFLTQKRATKATV